MENKKVPKFLFNKHNRKQAEEILSKEEFKRKTVSFYRYTIIDQPKELRDELFISWTELNVLGRIYLAKEGINAQLNVPEHNWDKFEATINSYSYFKNMPFKFAVQEKGVGSFYKLTIKVRKQIVADGLSIDDYDVTNVGKHLTAAQWNKAMNDGALVVDMRNHYESEIGHFKNAICPDSETFKEELPMVKDILKGKEKEKVLLYCTGGIRCEKTSSYLKHHGFEDVNQLHGGIIDYTHQVNNDDSLENLFIGKNFVFDDRVSERISDDVISNCHQCDKPCDEHTNCRNVHCNLLFIQCKDCKEKYKGCCSKECIQVNDLPEAEQKRLRSGKENKKMFHSHKKVDLRDKI
tara:strand:- start:894 stop:1943 length:1050 start_codon:yes stop_codon:yes gene_type:complete